MGSGEWHKTDCNSPRTPHAESSAPRLTPHATPHSPLHSPHYILLTPHSSFHSPHSPLPTPHFSELASSGKGIPGFCSPNAGWRIKGAPLGYAQFEPVARLPGVQLFSLQKGYGTEQLTRHQAQWGIVALGDELNDFMDTAAVMMNMDLIISADTLPVHLAGRWAYLCGPSCRGWAAGAGCWSVRTARGIRPCGCSARSNRATGTRSFRGSREN